MLAGRSSADVQADALATDQALLEELAVMLGKQEIGTREWRAAHEPIDRRIKDRQRQLAQATRADALVGLPGNSQQLRQQWAELSLTRQAAIVRALLDHAVIAPGTAGARSLDLDRVRPVWQL